MENKQTQNGYFKKYYRENIEVKKAKSKAYYAGFRTAVLHLLGDKCKRCGFSDSRALQVDHVNGGGVRETNAITTVYSKVVIESVRKKENKYKLLCANCNWI